VSEVMVNNDLVSFSNFLSDYTGLKISLSAPLLSGEMVDIKLVFSGSLPDEISSERFLYGTFYQGDHHDLWVLANVYPILANLSDGGWSAREVLPGGDPVTSQIALYSVRITIPSDWKMVATGTIVEENKISEELLRISSTSGPMRDFMIVAGKQLNQISVTTEDGIQLNQWFTPGAAEVNAEIALKIAKQALKIFQSEFGPYPYKELDMVAVPLDNALGVEYPGLVLLQDGLYQTPDEYNTFAIVIAHEIAHQWWYNLIGNDVYEAPWLDEALATYSGYLYARKLSPVFYNGVKQYQEGRVTSVESEFGPQPFDRPIDYYLKNEKAYSAIVYQKGAQFLDALRGEIGDQEFTQALRMYFSANRYKLVQPADFLIQFEEACSCHLDSFYTKWGVEEIP
jgi:aminopeptidase N